MLQLNDQSVSMEISDDDSYSTGSKFRQNKFKNNSSLNNIYRSLPNIVFPVSSTLVGSKDELSKSIADFKRRHARLPADYYTNSSFHPKLGPWGTWYVDFCESSRKVSKEDWFSNVVLIAICIAGINVGVQTYEIYFSEGTALFFYVLDVCIFIIFFWEMMVKIFAEGVRWTRYWTGPERAWNIFDFFIVIMTFPLLDGVLQGGSMVALLRLARLARLGKLIKRIPALQMIVHGLIGGLKSITYILLLLVIVFYIYAVMSIDLFGRSDPFHFGTLGIAMVSLFRVATLANWGDILFLETFGCMEYPTYYIPPPDDDGGDDDVWEGFHCNHPTTSYIVSPLYFVTFVVIASFVMFSLFIGAVTMSMSDSMEELKQSSTERKRLATFEKNRQKIQSMATSVVRRRSMMQTKQPQGSASVDLDAQRGSALGTLAILAEDEENEVIKKKRSDNLKKNLSFNKRKQRTSIIDQSKIMVAKVQSFVHFQRQMHQLDTQEKAKLKMSRSLIRAMGSMDHDAEAGVLEDEAREKRAEGLSGPLRAYVQLGYQCEWLAQQGWFNNFIIFVIIIAGVNVGIQSNDKDFDTAYEGKPLKDFTEWLDFLILYVFIIEFLIKVCAEKLQPWVYFVDDWNKFDFVIIVGSLIPGAGSAIMLVRLLRLLRVLKLVKKLPQLAIIVSALMMGLNSIGYVAFILLLSIYVFAILGILLYAESDPWHFGLLHDAMLTLIRAATLDEWTDLLYLEMFGCKKFPDVYEADNVDCPENAEGAYYTSVVYFGFFIMIVAQVLLTLFIGVISTSMEEARQVQLQESKVDEKLAKLRDEIGLSDEQIKDFKEVFNMLDLDGGGTIDETELSLGICLIDEDNPLTEEQMNNIFKKINPNRDAEIDIVGFIQFMCLTPKYRLNVLKKKTIRAWEKRLKKPKDTFYDKFQRAILYGAWSSEKQAEIKAALIIQAVWKSKKRARELAEITAKRKARKANKKALIKLNTSILDQDVYSSDDDSTVQSESTIGKTLKSRSSPIPETNTDMMNFYSRVMAKESHVILETDELLEKRPDDDEEDNEESGIKILNAREQAKLELEQRIAKQAAQSKAAEEANRNQNDSVSTTS